MFTSKSQKSWKKIWWEGKAFHIFKHAENLKRFPKIRQYLFRCFNILNSTIFLTRLMLKVDQISYDFTIKLYI